MYINLKITWNQIELYLKIEKKHNRKNFPYIWCELVRGILLIYFCIDLKIWCPIQEFWLGFRLLT